MKWILWICALCIAQVANAADVFISNQPRPFKLADQLEADATIGGYPIWQGEKKWRLFDIIRRDSSGDARAVPLGDVRLFQTEGKKFVAVMTVSANLAQGSAQGWIEEPCKRDDFLYKASIGPNFNNENCVTINHLVGFPGNPSGRSAELFSLLRENGVDTPPTVLQIALTRAGPSLRIYRVLLTINPELAGFSRETETQWGRNPWHKAASLNDPEKKRFIDALSAWALQFAKQMESAYQKKGDAFNSVPSWRTLIGGQAVIDPVKPKTTLD